MLPSNNSISNPCLAIIHKPRIPTGSFQVKSQKKTDRALVSVDVICVHTTINIRICLTNIPCGKKDGSLIYCIDFRALNKVTRKDAFSWPNIETCIRHYNKRKYLHECIINSVWCNRQTIEYTAHSWLSYISHGHRPPTPTQQRQARFKWKARRKQTEH
jgi:hypothetical protein